MAPSKYNNYASSQFPAISDTLHEAKISGDWDELKKQLSITAYLINNVADNLRSVTWQHFLPTLNPGYSYDIPKKR